jgi:hypothetical protein
MRMLEELTDVHQERLARVIPGLAEARAWPGVGRGRPRLLTQTGLCSFPEEGV